ncbi:uncharacterized protein H6S33_012300 [Morchella sextelata]|uniref:uncharacterized protein n=1 Tax=Morchella sextelata TaxID=1174677 RepID=UPI001D03EB07|nr:uncharacterized protein H6S33_012300 [Morchella sextelata]KAH0609754.1 hypothetical protein H6S33_012300 [Morchella sextelata]
MGPLPDPDSPADMTAHGLNNARPLFLQTTLLGRPSITEFLTLFSLPIPSTLPPRLDIPLGLPFPTFLTRLHTPATPMPERVRAWDIRMPLPWLYPHKHPDPLLPPRKIWATRLTPGRNFPETARLVEAFLERVGLRGYCCQFRGTTRRDVDVAVGAFGPAAVEPTDLGRGVYTTENLGLALAYAGGGQGVLWVFMEGEGAAVKGGLRVGRVEGKEWEWVAGGRPRGAEYVQDVVVGAVSADRGAAGMQGCAEGRCRVVPWVEGGPWMCWRSRKAWRVLAKGLAALVYLEEAPEVVEYGGWTVVE